MNTYVVLALAMVGGLFIAIASNLDPTLGATSGNYNTIPNVNAAQKVGGRKSRKQKKRQRKSRKL